MNNEREVVLLKNLPYISLYDEIQSIFDTYHDLNSELTLEDWFIFYINVERCIEICTLFKDLVHLNYMTNLHAGHVLEFPGARVNIQVHSPCHFSIFTATYKGGLDAIVETVFDNNIHSQDDLFPTIQFVFKEHPDREALFVCFKNLLHPTYYH